MESYITDIRYKEDEVIKDSKKDKKRQKKVERELQRRDDVEYVDLAEKKSSIFSKLFARRPDEYNVEESDFIGGEELDGLPLKEEVVQDVAEEFEELEKQESKIQRQRVSLFSRLFKKKEYNVPKDETEFDEASVELYDEKKDSEQVILLKDDLKKLGSITYEVIKKLEESELRKFKFSEDFAEYKTIMKKHNFIRTKY
ncbi:hypothetical protein GOV05_04600 [Candidatus Woesearchaeota archaeon]|nr:hypothetical protein [Candidatus Woesearchaeota archaeon]